MPMMMPERAGLSLNLTLFALIDRETFGNQYLPICSHENHLLTFAAMYRYAESGNHAHRS